MELHLHLSVAFRALDRKWGTPVDLDISGGYPCLPAVIESPSETFSSEGYLRTVKRSRARPTPYSRGENWKRKDNVKRCDSFTNISMSRFPSRSDLGGSITSLESSSGFSDCSSDLEHYDRNYEDIAGSTETLDSVLEKKKDGHFFKQLKNSAFSFVEKKRWKKLRL